MSTSAPNKFFVDCVQCGYCCGYRRDSNFGGCSYSEDEIVPPDIITTPGEFGPTVPVDEDDTCIYLVKLNNGFAKCMIQDKKPKMCKLYYCLTEKKVKYLRVITEELQTKCR